MTVRETSHVQEVAGWNGSALVALTSNDPSLGAPSHAKPTKLKALACHFLHSGPQFGWIT